MKVRYYGLWSATRRADLDHARDRLQAARATAAPIEVPVTPTTTTTTTTTSGGPAPPLICPLCHAGTLTVMAILRPERKVPP